MRNICFIVNNYLKEDGTPDCAFIHNFAQAVADEGVTVTVISPVSTLNYELRKLPYKVYEKTPSGHTIRVFFPRFFFIPKLLRIFKFINRINLFSYWASCKRVIIKENVNPDCFYGHFIYRAGICACKLGDYFNKPSFIAFGESSDWWSIKDAGGIRVVRKALKNVTGMIAVSSLNKEYLISNNICSPSKAGLFINGVDDSKFYPRDMRESRKLFGFPDDIFIIAFTGSFIERKGLPQLCMAALELDDAGFIYAGEGKLKPAEKNMLFAGPVHPDNMPYFLSAADIFVMPSKNEGCCNAILEALACGLPVVSSDLPFNYDILDESCSILVNPDSVEDIKNAILALKNNKDLRNRLSQGSIAKAAGFSLQKRANDVLQFINKMAQAANI